MTPTTDGTQPAAAEVPAAVLHLWGPVRVQTAGGVVQPGGPRERTVLAALAIVAGRPVSMERLSAWLWDGDPPDSARNSVQNAVLRLRQRLDGTGMRIEHVGDGYALQLGPAGIDVGGPGEPLEQTMPTAPRTAATLALREARHSAVERRLAEQIELDPVQAIPELELLLAEQPEREPLWALLMLAHYRAGRSAAALQAYGRARRALADALGLDPGPLLRELHRGVLDHDPRLLAEQSALARALLADAAARAAVGDIAGARQRYADAVAAALRADDVLLLADAAAGQAGEAQWVLGDTALEALLEQVLLRLGTPPVDPVRAGRAAAGLALLRAFRGDVRARAHAAQAAALTATGATPATRTAALFAAATAWEGPDDIDSRERNGRALIGHGQDTGDRTAQSLGEQYVAWAAMERGEATNARAGRQRMLQLAADQPSAHLAAQVADTRFLEAMLEGRFTDAGQRIEELGAAWRAAADPGIAMVTEVGAGLLLGELTTGLDALLPAFAALTAALPGDVMWPSSTALAHALAGRPDLAEAAMDGLTASALRALPRSTLWLTHVSGISQLAWLCKRPDLAAVVLELLQPLGGTHVVVAGLAYRGAVAYWQGLALHTIGRLHEAEASLRAGLAQHQAVNSPPWIAQAELALATTLLAQDPTRAATAAAHLENASETADQIGMTLLKQRCASLRQQAP